MRSLQRTSSRRRGTAARRAALGFGLVAAACSQGRRTRTPSTWPTPRQPATTTAAAATTTESRRAVTDGRPPRGGSTAEHDGHAPPAAAAETTADAAGRRCPPRRAIPCTAARSSSPVRPRSAPRGRRPRCSATRTASMRIRTFFDPLFVDRRRPPGARRSSSRASSPTPTTRSGRSRSARASASPTARRSTPTPSSTTFNRTWTGLLVQGAIRDVAQEPRRQDPGDRRPTTDTFTRHDRQERRPRHAAAVADLPARSSPVQLGFIASPTWLAAVDGNADLATQPVGTGPFIVAELHHRRPHDGRRRTRTTGGRTPTATSCRTSTRSSSA